MEQKAKVKLNLENNICQWMVRWAATMCCKYMVGKDEKAPYERKRRKKCNLIVVPFGERVLYKQIREGKGRRTKFETEDKDGIWLGHNRGTNEALIGTTHGVAQAYSFRRRHDASRWSQALIPMHAGELHMPSAQDNSERGSRFKVCVSRAQVQFGHSKESQDAVVLADEPERVEEHGRSTLVLAECDPEEEEEAVLEKTTRKQGLWWMSWKCAVSSPRTTPVARRMGLVAVQALVLRTGWDFWLPRHEEAALRYVRKVRSKLVIGSPGCTVFSQLQNLCGSHWDRHRRDGAESHAVHRGGVQGTRQSRTLVFA